MAAPSELRARDVQFAADDRRIHGARQCQVCLEAAAGAIDLRDIGLQKTHRIGLDRQIPRERPRAPGGIVAVRGQVALDQTGIACVESEAC